MVEQPAASQTWVS